MSFTLGQVVSGLPAKSGGRNNWGTTLDNSIGMIAAMQVIGEITESAELEELKYQTPVPPATPLTLTTGNPIIPISSLLATIQSNANYPQFQAVYSEGFTFTDVTDQYDGWLWFQGNGFQPNAVNQSGRVIEYRRVPAVDMYTYGVTSNTQTSYGTAPSVYYTRFNNNYQVGPSPDMNYPFFFRLKLRQPFYPTTQANTPIFAPDTWQQIFQYAAVLQLAKDEGITDGSFVKTANEFLKNRGMDMYTLRQVQMQRDEKHNQRSLSLRTARYTHA
jgi:hypothetical protein